MTVNNKEYDINKKYNFVIELISAPVISGKCDDENVCVFSVIKDSEGGAKPYNYYWYDDYKNVAITKSTVDNGDFKYELKDNLKHSIVMSTGGKYGRNYSEDSNEVVVYADMYKAPTVEILSEDAVDEGKQALLTAEAVAYGNKTIQKDGYNWTVPEGWEIVSGQGTNLLVVKVPGYSKDMPKGKFSVVATDSEGIESNVATKEVAVLFDSSLKPTTPSLLAADLNGQKDVVENTKYTVTASITASDGRKIVGYEWKVNGTRIKTTTNVFEQLAPSFNTIADNKIRVTVVAIDSAGQKSDESAEISIDVKADSSLKSTTPSLVAADLNGQKDVVEKKEYKVTATAQASDGRNIVGYQWKVNGTRIKTTTNIFEQVAPSFNTIADNKIRVTVVAIDSAGQKSDESAEISIDIKADSLISGPTNAVIEGADEAQEGTQVALKASATVGSGRVIKAYEWTVDDGKTETTTTANFTFTARSFDADNENQSVSLVVVDSVGNKSQAVTKAIKITADGSISGPTNAVIEGVDEAKERTQVALKAKATVAPGREIKAYKWTVEGEATETTITPDFTFTARNFDANKENQSVSLFVVDSAGKESQADTKAIKITVDSSLKPTKPTLLAAGINGQRDVVEQKQYKQNLRYNAKILVKLLQTKRYIF
ncbi:penicillin-Binding Protein family protein [Francisella sp. TX07-6608]|nr:penicillin-Binding Protein family protein [Francisella sp. TX07-6608]